MKILIFLAAFLVAISILVAVHEFGHYWVAKKLGFKVLRFSIGFGKPLLTRVGKDPDRTEYCLSAIPLGGYVKLLDEREGDVAAAELPRSFTRRPIAASHRRAAGGSRHESAVRRRCCMRFWRWSEPRSSSRWSARCGSIVPAAIAGLQRGDEIVRVGDRKVADTEELQIALIRQFTDDGVVPLRVRRDGATRR